MTDREALAIPAAEKWADDQNDKEWWCVNHNAYLEGFRAGFDAALASERAKQAEPVAIVDLRRAR